MTGAGTIMTVCRCFGLALPEDFTFGATTKAQADASAESETKRVMPFIVRGRAFVSSNVRPLQSTAFVDTRRANNPPVVVGPASSDTIVWPSNVTWKDRASTRTFNMIVKCEGYSRMTWLWKVIPLLTMQALERPTPAASAGFGEVLLDSPCELFGRPKVRRDDAKEEVIRSA
jgi:hypothetical protein